MPFFHVVIRAGGLRHLPTGFAIAATESYWQRSKRAVWLEKNMPPFFGALFVVMVAGRLRVGSEARKSIYA
jgi:hypothetical protein